MQEFGAIFGCRARSSLRFELPLLCSLGKFFFVLIPLVILLGSPSRGSADVGHGPGGRFSKDPVTYRARKQFLKL